MSTKGSLFLVSCCFLLLLGACCKKMQYCSAGKLDIKIAGFNRLDVRTIIVRRYAVGNFTKALDSTVFTYGGSKPMVAGKKDTLDFADYTVGASTTISSVSLGNDWDIYLPGAKRAVFRVMSLNDEGHRSEMVKCGDNETQCVNRISGFMVNGAYKYGNTLWIENN